MTPQQLERLAGVGHGVMLFGGVIGLAWNIFRRKRFMVGFHAGVLTVNTVSLLLHVRDGRSES